MSLYVYKKKGLIETSKPQYNFEPPPPPTLVPAHPPRQLLTLPTITASLGLLLIAFVAWPILAYELLSEKSLAPTTAKGLINPLVQKNTYTLAAPKIVGSTDFTNATNWFPNAVVQNYNVEGPQSYQITIPKLKINEAKVTIGSNDLSKSLIHYAGTATPGQYGSPVIFGHSILPQFYNPTNYMAIFSTLPTLEKDDEIIVKYDDITYTYKVSEKQEVMPEDLWVLEQHYDSKKLKLITCVPPGLKTKRLVVTAELVQI